ncbi:MAG: RIP metalloprotease RseP [Cytophagales bacterium]|nr:RIP metalloprotease RseP [Bernardetiaceae bacterium]MDW8204262.1 RIP metalloprotease RseP [Cytophagales bacterium]
MEGLIMTAQLILAITIMVGLHELGHMLPAKWFGMRVEKFSIGFPPKLFSFKKGETEYMVGALPLGGFVKIAGMVDESLDTAQLSSKPQPWEYRSKPAYQRLIVMLGGITVNVLTGIVVFIGLAYFLGETYLPISEVNKHGIHVSKLAAEIGLQEGDKLIAINGKKLERYEDARNPSFFLETGSYYTVLRNGKEMMIPLPTDLMDKLGDKQNASFIDPLYPFAVGEVQPDMPAGKAGLQPGDKIIAANDTPILYFQHLKSFLEKHKGEEVKFVIDRKGEQVIKYIQITPEGTIGFRPEFLLQTAVRKYSLAEAVVRGTFNAFDVVFVQLKAFGKMFRGEMSVTKSLSGPIGIAKVFGGTWDWIRFWSLVGLLSMVLAFMNLLPIPALDGGHAVFLTYEIISGRAPSQAFLEGAQKVGMLLLLGLMVFAFGNDIYKLIFN